METRNVVLCECHRLRNLVCDLVEKTCRIEKRYHEISMKSEIVMKKGVRCLMWWYPFVELRLKSHNWKL